MIAQPLDAVIVDDAGDPASGKEDVQRHVEDPLRLAELGLDRRERGDRAIDLDPVEVPPAGPVGDEVQQPVRRPRRLEDRLFQSTRDQARVRCAAVGCQVGEPEFGAVPRHVGMVPFESRRSFVHPG